MSKYKFLPAITLAAFVSSAAFLSGCTEEEKNTHNNENSSLGIPEDNSLEFIEETPASRLDSELKRGELD